MWLYGEYSVGLDFGIDIEGVHAKETGVHSATQLTLRKRDPRQPMTKPHGGLGGFWTRATAARMSLMLAAVAYSLGVEYKLQQDVCVQSAY